MRPITHIVIHCSATPNGDARFTIEDLERMHRERGWRKVGYHYVIHVDGLLYAGRPLEEIGAHVQGSNAKSVGICLIGTDHFTAGQWATLRDLVASLRVQFPGATVCGHRDFSPDRDGDGVIEGHEFIKTCPGFDVAAWLAGGMEVAMEHLEGTVQLA